MQDVGYILCDSTLHEAKQQDEVVQVRQDGTSEVQSGMRSSYCAAADWPVSLRPAENGRRSGK